MDYKEEDFLMISEIQHFVFCRRQWAFIHIEQQWADNYLTIDGDFMHKKVHDGSSTEKRKDIIISRGLPIHSYELGLSGECDVVEFHEDENGIPIKGRKGNYRIVPVEYKRGKPKAHQSDELQLAAQAMCLEEMFCCEITKGYLFYGEPKRRTEVIINEDIRTTLRETLKEMHALFERKYTPKVKPSRNCKACSLSNVCLPEIMKQESAKEYINRMLRRNV